MSIDSNAIAQIPMPRLSDVAVVQIHHFLEHVLDLFEARYGDQIHRYLYGCLPAIGSNPHRAVRKSAATLYPALCTG
jgi:hypothetical protein